MTSATQQRIGIDLGGTKIEGIVLDPDNHVSQRLRVATPKNTYTETVEAACLVVEELQQSSKQLLSVGFGTPGSLSPETGLMRNCNSTALNDRPLKSDLEARLGYSIRLENDANCFTLSEAVMGAGKGARTVFGVIIGTGTGGGIVVGKQLLNGPNGIAGEWGHNTIPVAVAALLGAERDCYCGRKNCIETVLSGAGLMTTYKEMHGAGELPVWNAQQLAELAAKNDTKALSALRRYSEQLAGCLATVINTLDPDTIVLGGGLSNINSLYPMLAEFLPKHVFSDFFATPILPPKHGAASGALGAACLWDSGGKS